MVKNLNFFNIGRIQSNSPLGRVLSLLILIVFTSIFPKIYIMSFGLDIT